LTPRTQIEAVEDGGNVRLDRAFADEELRCDLAIRLTTGATSPTHEAGAGSRDAGRDLNPIGRIYYAASTMLCTPASLAQEVGLALGAQAGEPRMREVASKAGYSEFRRAAETPFNIVYEARP
jgi:hypothetical protein